MRGKMKKRFNFRLIFYVALFIAAALAIQLKKSAVLKERSREVVSIPSEIHTHGWPVDTELVESNELYDALRVTVLSQTGEKNQVYFYLSRDQVALVKVGQKVIGLEDHEPIGEITSISAGPMMSNGLYRGAIALNKSLKSSDQTIQAVDIVTRVLKNTLSVPIEAVDNSNEKQSQVWVAKEGQVSPVQVTLGVLGQGRIEVKEGLNVGDRVITNGHKALYEGAKVRIREAAL